METNPIEYIIEHVEHDINLNKAMTGTDYSGTLGGILYVYANNPGKQEDLGLKLVLAISNLEKNLGDETGTRPIFHETKKCALPILRLYHGGNKDGLDKICAYFDELMLRFMLSR